MGLVMTIYLALDRYISSHLKICATMMKDPEFLFISVTDIRVMAVESDRQLPYSQFIGIRVMSCF